MTPPDSADRSRASARGFRLQWEPAQDCHVLLYPEGMVKLNQQRRRDPEALRRRSAAWPRSSPTWSRPSRRTGLERDVLAFVEMAGKQRWLAWD